MKHPAFASIAIVTLFSGIQCTLPERLYSIIPPTNERQLCQQDARYYYSTSFDFCLTYPSGLWQKTDQRPPRTVGVTTITEYPFWYQGEDFTLPIFSLFIARSSETTRDQFNEREINTVHDENNLLIGYRISLPTANVIDEDYNILQAEVPAFLDSYTQF